MAKTTKREKIDFNTVEPEMTTDAAAEAAKAVAGTEDDKLAKGDAARNSTMVFFFTLRKPSFRRRLREDEVSVRSRAALRAEEEAEDDDDNDANDEDSVVEVGFDFSMLKVSKELLPREALRPIRALDAEFKRWLRYYAVPTGIVGGGKFVIPTRFVAEVDGGVLKFVDERHKRIDSFVANFEAFKREAKIQLGELYKESDYPTPEAIRAAFSVEYSWKAFDVPRALKGVNIQIMRREMAKVRLEWANAADEMRDGMRVGLSKLVDEAVEKFTVTTENEKVSFSATFLDRINKFLATFDGRDLTDDKEARGLVEQLRATMSGVTAEGIKKDDSIREKVVAAFSEVQKQMSEAEMIRGGRKLRSRKPEADDRIESGESGEMA